MTMCNSRYCILKKYWLNLAKNNVRKKEIMPNYALISANLTNLLEYKVLESVFLQKNRIII